MANARKPSGSTTTHVPGIRTIKEYPVTEETLDTIATLRTSATVCFAVGSLTAGFALSCWQALSMGEGTVAPAVAATWSAYRWSAVVVTLIAYVGGFIFWAKGGSVIQTIKDNTTHAP